MEHADFFIGREFWTETGLWRCTANVFDWKNQAEIKNRYSWVGTPFDCDDAYPFTASTGQFKPNAYGLQDMLGNVWEWTADCYHDTYQGAPKNGSAWEDQGACLSGLRVLRDGSWNLKPADVRSALRNEGRPVLRYFNIGFQLARTP